MRSITSLCLKRSLGLALALAFTLALCACANHRLETQTLAQSHQFKPIRFASKHFVLRGWLKAGQGDTIHVYIEGDGMAWRRSTRPSSDPTPTNPIGLRLAASDPSDAPVLYLGRPGQYVEGADRRGCSVRDWTSARFSQRALAATDEAINQAMRQTQTTRVLVCGFSGGAALAGMLAATREDVVFLASVAGNLAPDIWTRQHDVSPLTESLPVLSYAAKTARIPQLHLVGGDDSNITSNIAEAWMARVSPGYGQVEIVPGLDHEGPWERYWPRLFARYYKTLPQESEGIR